MTTYVTFHGVGTSDRPLEDGEEPVWVDQGLFRDVLDFLAADKNGVVITFDDGNRSDVDIALPALLERELHASFFVLAGKLDKRGYLSTTGVAELATAGMTVGTHGLHHRDWRTLDNDALEAEIMQPIDILSDIVGSTVNEAACPFGSYDRRILGRLRSAGYKRVYTSDGGPASDDAWLIPRTTIHATDTVGDLQALVRPGARPSAVKRMKRAMKRFR